MYRNSHFLSPLLFPEPLTSFCRFVATHTVTTAFRCCAVHASPFTGPCCNPAAFCNILSAIATQSARHCNTSPVRPPPLATSRPSLQQPLRHCNATRPLYTFRYNTSRARLSHDQPIGHLHPPCNMQHSYVRLHLATSVTLQHFCFSIATLKCNHYIVVGKSTSMRCIRNPYVNSL